jgi:hypothetical protein
MVEWQNAKYEVMRRLSASMRSPTMERTCLPIAGTLEISVMVREKTELTPGDVVLVTFLFPETNNERE